MYQFSHTWPYERVMGDLYLTECPFCGSRSVPLHLKKEAFERAKEGIKTEAVLPCCHEKLTILRIDDDYLWTDRALR
jgi:hypothetical protein